MTIINVKAAKHPSQAGLVNVESGPFDLGSLTITGAEQLRADLAVAIDAAKVLKERAEEAAKRKNPGNGTVVRGRSEYVRIGKDRWMRLTDHKVMDGTDKWFMSDHTFDLVHFEPRD